MLKNYLKVTLRAIARHKAFSAITVFGLSLSMAVCLLILTFVWEQAHYDDFHQRGDRIVRILSDRLDERGDVQDELAASPAPLADVLRRDVPGIEATTRIGQIRSLAIHAGKGIPVEGLYAEPSFFDLFDFALVSGDAKVLLGRPGQIILTQETATAVFGARDPVGQTLTLERHGEFTVGGILAEPPGPSHLKFDMLVSFVSQAQSDRREELTSWQNSWHYATYLLLEEGGSLDRLQTVLDTIGRQQYAGQEARLAFRLQRLEDIALGPVLGNEIASYSVPALLVYFLAVLGLVIMMAAGFNYVSLSVARALRRAQEVGVRKVVGAQRWQVVLQFLSEAVLMALLSLLVAVSLLVWLVPVFNNLTFIQLAGVSVDAGNLIRPRLFGLFVAFSIGVGLLAGLYPAWHLSRFQPIVVLKGLKNAQGFSGTWLRRGLAGIQFALALFFVTTTALLYAQFTHLVQADYGFQQEGMVTLALQGQDLDLLREELQRNPSILQVAATSKLPASGSTSRIELGREGMDEALAVFEYAVDPAFIESMGLHLVAGRNFSREITSDTASAVILNQTAAQTLGFENPSEALDTWLTFGGPERPVQVIGVVADYHYNVLVDPIDALVLHYSPDRFQYALVRTQPAQADAALAHVEAVWERIDPVHPVAAERFDLQLSDGILNRVIRDLTGIIGFVALLAVVVSCLGLLGMALYTVELRLKEVGVRKVLGATRRSLLLLLSREYARLVFITSMLAVPLIWLVSSQWLQIFASRIDLSPWLVAGCVVGMALLALGVITTQTFRATRVDPVRTLRSE